jgi:hypothetical protein
MSALGYKRTRSHEAPVFQLGVVAVTLWFCERASRRLFDHFVCAREQRGRHGKAEGLGGF